MATPQPDRNKNLIQPTEPEDTQPEPTDAGNGQQGGGRPTGNPRSMPDSKPTDPVIPPKLPDNSSGPSNSPTRGGGENGGPAGKPSPVPDHPPSPQNPAAPAGGAAATPDSSRPPVDTEAIGNPLPVESLPMDDQDDSDSNLDDLKGQDGDTPEQDDSEQADSPKQKSDDASDSKAGTGGTSTKGTGAGDMAKGMEAGAGTGGGGAAVAGGAESAAGAAEAAKTAATVGRAGMALTTLGPFGIIIIAATFIGMLFMIVIIGMAGANSGSGTANSESRGTSGSASGGSVSCKKLTGTPKEVVDKVALPIAHQIAFKEVTAESVEAANAAHGPTSTGNTSDHQGPPDVRWAADISNGSAPTPEMDQLAKGLAKCFEIPWTGEGGPTHSKDGYRMQLIYRTSADSVYGDHMDHVHIGVAKE